jgi:7-cyano-7-deazaguanine synthase
MSTRSASANTILTNSIKDIPKKAVVMLSDGLDSTVLAYALRDRGQRPLLRGIAFNLGGGSLIRTRRVLNVVSRHLNIPIEVLDIPGIMHTFTGISDGPSTPPASLSAMDAYLNCFPAFVSLAGTWAAAIGYDAVVLGHHSDDRTDDPKSYDNLRTAYGHVEKALATAFGKQFQIATPLWDVQKKDLILWGSNRRVPLQITWSCYLNGLTPCGQCEGCVDRRNAFDAAKIADPALKEKAYEPFEHV